MKLKYCLVLGMLSVPVFSNLVFADNASFSETTEVSKADKKAESDAAVKAVKDAEMKKAREAGVIIGNACGNLREYVPACKDLTCEVDEDTKSFGAIKNIVNSMKSCYDPEEYKKNFGKKEL